MATTTLTPRQQQIKKLLDEGKTPGEVAKRLKISGNGVYQHMRRIRASGGTVKATGNGGGSKRSTKRRSGTKRRSTSTRRRPTPTPHAPTEVREMTPLQAIRHRKAEIEHQLRESEERVEAARKTLAQEEEHHTKISARLEKDGELTRLNAAEAALSGAARKPPKRLSTARRRSPSQNGKGTRAPEGAQAPAPAAEAPVAPQAEPQAERVEPDPMAAVAAGEVETEEQREMAAVAAGEMERPGVPADPDFEQTDGFEDGN